MWRFSGYSQPVPLSAAALSVVLIIDINCAVKIGSVDVIDRHRFRKINEIPGGRVFHPYMLVRQRNSSVNPIPDSGLFPWLNDLSVPLCSSAIQF